MTAERTSWYSWECHSVGVECGLSMHLCRAWSCVRSGAANHIGGVSLSSRKEFAMVKVLIKSVRYLKVMPWTKLSPPPLN